MNRADGPARWNSSNSVSSICSSSSRRVLAALRRRTSLLCMQEAYHHPMAAPAAITDTLCRKRTCCCAFPRSHCLPLTAWRDHGHQNKLQAKFSFMTGRLASRCSVSAFGHTGSHSWFLQAAVWRLEGQKPWAAVSWLLYTSCIVG